MHGWRRLSDRQGVPRRSVQLNSHRASPIPWTCTTDQPPLAKRASPDSETRPPPTHQIVIPAPSLRHRRARRNRHSGPPFTSCRRGGNSVMTAKVYREESVSLNTPPHVTCHYWPASIGTKACPGSGPRQPAPQSSFPRRRESRGEVRVVAMTLELSHQPTSACRHPDFHTSVCRHQPA